MLRLTPRLQAAASLVTEGAVIADVGTDHAYLPVFLCQSGVISKAIASDVRTGPLENARKTLAQTGLEDRIELRLSDGLKNFSPNEVSDIVICGMGGILISEILENAPWVCKEGVHLILQPMSHPQNVREYLFRHGFYIENELYVREGRRVYLCLRATSTGKYAEPEIGRCYFGDLTDRSETAGEYARRIYDHILKRLSSLISSGKEDAEEVRLLREAADYYERNTQNEGT